MSSIAQLVSELAHSVQQADSVPVRKALKLSIIHARNDLIRKSYGNHNYVDKGLQQRIKLTLTNVPDGDLNGVNIKDIGCVKRTTNKVPRPTRFTNNLPFLSVRTAGVKTSIEIPFAREASSRFYGNLPGLCGMATYDYINEYIYINTSANDMFNNLGAIIVESVFEYPHLIPVETNEDKFYENLVDDNDEFLIPEDMIQDLKKIVLETYNASVVRQTNEINRANLVK